MRNYDLMLILVSLFVVRIIAFSASYADAICLLSLVAYKFGKDFLVLKRISSDFESKLQSQEKETNAKLNLLAEEIVKVRNSSEGLKAAINLTAKR
jgi:hypothetical protein